MSDKTIAIFIYSFIAIVLLILILTALFISYKVIKSKKNIFVKLLITVPVLYIFAYGGLVGLKPALGLIYSEIKSCNEQIKKFTFAQCSVTFADIEISSKCLPCAGASPCAYGFDSNKKIEILSCLCKTKQYKDVERFKSQYLVEDFFNNLPKDPMEMCNNIPEKMMYL